MGAFKQAPPTLCIRTKDACLMLCARAGSYNNEKTHRLHEGPSSSCLHMISPNVGCLCLGAPGDALAQVRYAMIWWWWWWYIMLMLNSSFVPISNNSNAIGVYLEERSSTLPCSFRSRRICESAGPSPWWYFARQRSTSMDKTPSMSEYLGIMATWQRTWIAAGR